LSPICSRRELLFFFFFNKIANIFY
jgi:hypothetical protein